MLVFDLCIWHLLYHRPLILELVLGSEWKLCVGCIKYINIDFLPSMVCEIPWRGFRFCSYNFNYQFIDCIQGNNPKVLPLISFKRCYSSGWAIDIKASSVVVTVWCFKSVAGIWVDHRCTKDHWFNPFYFFQLLYIGYRCKCLYWFINIISDKIFYRVLLSSFVCLNKCTIKDICF